MQQNLKLGIVVTCLVANLVWHRTAAKLPVIYPYGGTFKLIIGVSVPINLEGRLLSYAHNFQFQYPLPPNNSDFSSARLARRRRSIMSGDRSLVYRLLELEWQRNGVGGRDCMKRSICESAWLALNDEGLLGELLHVLLTPTYGGGLFVDQDYLRAMEAGKRGDDCLQLYSLCPKGYGILDIFEND